tara:strand:+ start:50 stop:667 length:618 start_codon:yes stop_codon:yes gene_type:complete
MKKILGIVVLGLLLSGNVYAKVGKGELKMSLEMIEYFKKYLRNEYASTFVISADGKFALYGICGVKTCSGGPGHTATMMKNCKSVYGDRCYIFAQRKNQKKIIRWNKNNYEFPKEDWNYNASVKAEYLSSKNKGIKSDISDNDIVNVLIKLGFANKNEKKEFKENQNPSESIVSKIQKLFDLHKSGALNEEEFQMAKNILLSSET